jgi:DNA-binding HxlR family transcriptional regulator
MTALPFPCGFEAALAVIGGKWKLLILFHLAKGPHRYSDLRRAVTGVSDKMLTQQLKELQADGIVDRRDYQEVPPRVDYSLTDTDLGRTLVVAIAPLCAWGTEHRAEVERRIARRESAAKL